MSKKSKKNQIHQDIDGSFFCSKCGKAGYQKQADAWGHLRWCKGIKKISKDIEKEFSEIQGVGQGNNLNYLFNEVGDSFPPASLSSVHTEIDPDEVEGEALPQDLPQALNLTKRERILSAELAKAKAFNRKLYKYSTNHIQHASFSSPRRVSNPTDLLFSGMNDLIEDHRFRKLLMFGALVFMTVKAAIWLKDSADKLEKKK